MKSEYHIIGLMSGTSLDGLDLAYCTFSTETPFYKIEFASTYNYDEKWKKRLKEAHLLSAEEIALLDADLSDLFASRIKQFIEENTLSKIDAISSHGHTIFHQPNKGFTQQIGKAAYLAAKTGYTVISDFRSADVALGGQGAPLVPIGDRTLFSNYSNRINLGGFANISFEENDKTLAYDICPANMALNDIASELGVDFDDKGKIAQSSIVNENLLKELNELDYYLTSGPKSLGKEWYEYTFRPIIQKNKAGKEEKLRTIVEHIAIQLNRSMIVGSALITGGGALNDFLIDRIKAHTDNEIVLPEKKLIDFKEAMIFAYLGYLCLLGEINILSSVTGSSIDHCGGSIHI